MFVNDGLGKIPGALPMSAVEPDRRGAHAGARHLCQFPHLRRDCDDALQCTVGVADTPLATGQGNHGSFSRAETRNFMAAIGPDFKAGFADPAPVSNADIAPTLAQIDGPRPARPRAS